MTTTATRREEFSRLDVVKDDSDHKYRKQRISDKPDDGFNDRRNSLYRKIMQEWKILRESLPDIYVRAYEHRIDLLRAIIIGPKSTPYRDGLFFFDIAFPSNYPNSPLLFWYHSYGIRLNPNLYSSGYVYLSILNIWYGWKSEKWDPSRSSILQVLVSVQGLVLNDKPYYNEPSAKPAWTWKQYNEIVVGLSCKTMVSVLQNPPKNFEDFVASHFRERACHVLKAIQSYEDGTSMAGFYEERAWSMST